MSIHPEIKNQNVICSSDEFSSFIFVLSFRAEVSLDKMELGWHWTCADRLHDDVFVPVDWTYMNPNDSSKIIVHDLRMRNTFARHSHIEGMQHKLAWLGLGTILGRHCKQAFGKLKRETNSTSARVDAITETLRDAADKSKNDADHAVLQLELWVPSQEIDVFSTATSGAAVRLEAITMCWCLRTLWCLDVHNYETLQFEEDRGRHGAARKAPEVVRKSQSQRISHEREHAQKEENDSENEKEVWGSEFSIMSRCNPE